jgi:transposase
MADALGVSEAAVSQWRPRARVGGPEALQPRPSPGAPRRLSAEQLAPLPAWLPRRPAASGLRGQVWPRNRVAEVRRAACGVVYHPTQVGRLLTALRWRPQQPARRAQQRGDCVPARRGVARAQQGAEAQQQTLRFLDASGCSPLPSVVRTDAPVGQTPILRAWCTRDHLAALSALSPEGKRSCHSQARAIDAADVVMVLEPLRREVPGRMVLIWAGAPLHRSHRLQACLSHGAAPRLHLERLPAYAPELTPGEGLWQQLTGGERRHVGGCHRPQPRRALREAVKRARRQPSRIHGVFRGAKL